MTARKKPGLAMMSTCFIVAKIGDYLDSLAKKASAVPRCHLEKLKSRGLRRKACFWLQNETLCTCQPFSVWWMFKSRSKLSISMVTKLRCSSWFLRPPTENAALNTEVCLGKVICIANPYTFPMLRSLQAFNLGLASGQNAYPFHF
jgi:hypothetical protein